jgi:hypothetical protein
MTFRTLALRCPICSPEHLQTSICPSPAGSSHSILPPIRNRSIAISFECHKI